MQTHELERCIKALEAQSSQGTSKYVKTFETKAEAEANFAKKKPFRRRPVGAHVQFSDYRFPKNDKIVSKGKTPGQKGARPCRHCGSLNHWDFDHPINGKDDRRAKAFLSNLDSEALEAYVAYENCYLKDSEPEEEGPTNTIKEEVDPQNFSDDEDFLLSPA